MSVTALLANAARAHPTRVAVAGPDATWTYAALDDEAARVAAALVELGVGRGDRVAVWMKKGSRAVSALQGVLRAGASYIPLDPLGPAARAGRILADGDVRALIAPDAAALSVPRGGWRQLDPEGEGGDLALADVDARHREVPAPDARDLAWILYTSGSTGRPKGVAVHHGAARAFIDWAADLVDVRANDRLANHAPFHFDLSVFDLYAAFSRGASVHLVPELLAYAPRQLVRFLERSEVSVWYSVPSALVLMMQRGGLLEADLPRWRACLFAGEPFPLSHLRRLVQAREGMRFWNFYGPTETNVCTFHEVTPTDLEAGRPLPIGRAASGDTVWVGDDDGGRRPPGELGELWVRGPSVMKGYFGQPPIGGTTYRTGDLARERDDGVLEYHGRIDDMVKLRGHRVELGEVEAGLDASAYVAASGAVVVGGGLEARLVCFVEPADPAHDVTLAKLRKHCGGALPRAMWPDEVRVVSALPRTANGKLDRAALGRLAEGER